MNGASEVAGTGEASDLITRTKFSTDLDNPYGQGIAGQAFRTQKSAINQRIVHQRMLLDPTAPVERVGVAHDMARIERRLRRRAGHTRRRRIRRRFPYPHQRRRLRHQRRRRQRLRALRRRSKF